MRESIFLQSNSEDPDAGSKTTPKQRLEGGIKCNFYVREFCKDLVPCRMPPAKARMIGD